MSHPWKDLIGWQKAHQLVLEIYEVTSDLPDKEFSSFLHNSRGSLEETRYHLLLARDLGYLEEDIYDLMEKQATEVSFLLNKLISSISK